MITGMFHEYFERFYLLVHDSFKTLTLVSLSYQLWPLVSYQMIIGNLMFEAYFQVLYSLLVHTSFRTQTIPHWFPFVTIGCPCQALVYQMITENLKLQVYFEVFCPLV